MLAPFAIAVLVYDQDALPVGSTPLIVEQELEAALVDLLLIPPGLREEPLQALRFLALRSCQGLGVSKRGEGLVSLGREQQSLQITPETFALGASTKEIIEALGVVF